MSRPELVESRVASVLAVERASATPIGPTGPRRSAGTATGSAATVPAVALELGAAQAWFQAVITHPGELESGVGLTGVAAEAVLAPGARTTALDGLAVYHHAYRARLVECLVDDYPALQHALGAEAFAAHAEAYIAAYPSRSPNLNAYGRHMAPFSAEAGMAFAADLARLEWALVEVLHAADAAPLAEAELAKVAPERWADAVLVPSDTFRLARFGHPVNAYFQAFMDEAPIAIPAAAPTALAIYRQGFRLWRMDLTAPMADLLEDLVRGATLGAALGAMEERLAPEELPEVAASVMVWFGAWVKGGFFQTVRFP